MFSFPTISAIKSNNAGDHEQGVVQGALMTAKSVAAAVGPALLKWTEKWDFRGAIGVPFVGSGMWIAAAILYFISMVMTLFLPREQTDFKFSSHIGGGGTKKGEEGEKGGVEERLLENVTV